MPTRNGWTAAAVGGLCLLWAVLPAGCRGGARKEAASRAAQGTDGAAAVEAGRWEGGGVFAGTNRLAGVWAARREKEATAPADNSYCYVCHANFRQDDLTRLHQPAGVGCELCHGMSDEHSADEDGLTPPDIMWPKAWINVTCMECHSHEALAEESSHAEFLARSPPAQTCTDCHGGGHRLGVRTRVWDRKTGKLIACDGVRMMDADSPAGAAR